MPIPMIGPTTDNAQDLSAKTLDEMRRRFLTECQIISSITTASALQLKYEALQELFHLNLNSRSLDIYHPATNDLLDNLALLLDKGRCEDSVAVAFTAYTGKSISIISRGIAKKRARHKYEAAVGRTKVPNFSRPLGPKYNHEREPGVTVSPPERSITKALKLPLIPKGIRKIFVELKARKEELQALRARSEQELSSPQPGGNSPDSEDPEDYSDIEGDADQEFSMIQAIASPGMVENITFKRVSLIAQTLFLTKEVLHSRHLHRYMKGKNPEITVLSSINNAKTTEFECENLIRTSSWLLPQHYGPGNQNREVTVKNFISSMKESLASRPAKARQLTRMVKDTPEHPRIFIPQHPELSLLSYLAKQNNAGDYPYPYIGLAKPPCLVCGIVLLGSKSYSAMGANPDSPCSCLTRVPTDLPALAQGLIYSSVDRLAGKVSRSFNQERIIASYRG
ncbi:hypothetical protein TWF751_004201 [Orbilia oligospora]|nr:hypothetical protein TWF751_004201 [Orbilia oligospora]